MMKIFKNLFSGLKANNYSNGVSIYAFALLVLAFYSGINLLFNVAESYGAVIVFNTLQKVFLYAFLGATQLVCYYLLTRSNKLQYIDRLYKKKPEVKLAFIGLSCYVIASTLLYIFDPDTPFTDFLYIRTIAYSILGSSLMLTVARFIIELWFPVVDKMLEPEEFALKWEAIPVKDRVYISFMMIALFTIIPALIAKVF